MHIFKNFIILIIFIFFLACSKSNNINTKNELNENDIELQVLQSYKEGMKELENGDALFAAKKFNEVEILFPQSEWASKSTLMAAYAYYSQDYYFDAAEELKIFFKKYPNHPDTDYATYLMAMTYYEQIVDEKKDLNSITMAMEYFQKVVNKYPNTDYAIDANFKIDLITDILASKEMYLGRYYFERKKWIAAINRFRYVIDNYDTTIYTEEALHRLVEIHYRIGMLDEAEKYAALLGYNYLSSTWYEKSYSLLNKNYQEKSKNKNKDKNFIIEKFKSLFN